MPWDGNGFFFRTNGFNQGTDVWGQDAATIQTIVSDRHDTHDQDLATGMNNALTKDGQSWPPTADLNLANQKFLNVGNALARDQYLSMGQRQDAAGVWCGTAGGTANAITLTPSPAITAYVAGQTFSYAVSADNTGAVTAAVSGLSAKAVVDIYNNALRADTFKTGQIVNMSYDGTSFRVVSPNRNLDALSQDTPTNNFLLGSNGTRPRWYGGIEKKTANYTATVDDHLKSITVDAAAAARTITLPSLTSAGAGFRIRIQKIDTSLNTVTIDGDGTDQINGQATLVLYQVYDSVLLENDGSEWLVVDFAFDPLLVLGPNATTSGTSVTVDVPSDAKAIHLSTPTMEASSTGSQLQIQFGTSAGIYTGNYFSNNAAAGQSQWTLTPNHGTGTQYDTGNATFRRTDPNGDVWTIWSEYFTRLGGSVSGRTLGGYVDLPGKITQFKYMIAAGSFEDGDFTLQIER